MSTTVLVILALVLIVVLLLVIALVRGSKMKKRLIAETLANAVPAQATVLSLASGGFKTGGKMEVKLTLRVHHPQLPHYDVSTKWVVEQVALPQVQPQQVIPVKVNRENPERVYPAADWADFWDWMMTDMKVKSGTANRG